MSLDISDKALNTRYLTKHSLVLSQYDITGLKIKDLIKINIKIRNLFNKLLTLNMDTDFNGKIADILPKSLLHLTFSATSEEELQKISKLKSLRYLDLIMVENNISLSPLQELSQLEKLMLRFVTVNNFSSLSKLRHLSYLVIENTKTIKGIGKCKNLQTLLLSNIQSKKLSSLNEEIVKLDNLHTLLLEDIYTPNEYDKKRFTFKDMKSLKFILIQRCKICELYLNNCSKLETFHLINNVSTRDDYDPDTDCKDMCFEMDLADCLSLKEVVIINATPIGLDLFKGSSNIESFYLKSQDNILSGNLECFSHLTKLRSLIIKAPVYMINLTNVAKLTSLTSLSLTFNYNFESVTGLKYLTNLVYLSLKGKSKCTDLSEISNCKQLKRLKIGLTNIKNITPLSSLTKLSLLKLSNCKVKRLFPLKRCSQLKEIIITSCSKLVSLDGIQECKNLTSLNVNPCYSLADITSVSGCTNLTTFKLNCFLVSSVISLSECINLIDVQIVTNYVTDVETLYNLPHLKTLKINYSTNYVNCPLKKIVRKQLDS